LDESVFVRIGKNEAADGAVLGSNLGLDTAPRVVIARDDDLALHGNAHAIELLVVLRDTVVHVDELSGDVSVDRVRVIGGKLLGLLIRGGILRKRGLLKLGCEFRAAFDQLNSAFRGRGKRTSNCSMWVSRPNSLNFAAIHSALSLS